MLSIPQELEDSLLKYIKDKFYRGTKRQGFAGRPFGTKDLHFFAKGVAELSRLFTSDRSRMDSSYLNRPELHAAYLLYFLPINFAKNLFLLEQFPAKFWQQEKYRVLDLGAGPGSASLAFLARLGSQVPKAEVQLTLVDQNQNILQDAERLIRGLFGNQISLKKVATELRKFHFAGPYDLILMSHSLNELRQDSALERAQWLGGPLREQLSPWGIFAASEPALKRPTRELMALRDHLLEGGDYKVLAPCLHEEICPMLAATRNDWCHFYLNWREPAYLAELDRMIRNDNRFLKVAYLILGRKDHYEKLRRQEVFRVVSNRMATRGKTELVLCGPPGRIKLVRLDRDRTTANEDLDRVRRGDLVELKAQALPGFEVERNLRLQKKSTLKLLT